MKSLRNIAEASLLTLLLVSVALTQGNKSKESTEGHQNQDGTWLQEQATTQLIGIVYDKDSRPGDQISASITTDPAKYRDIPALGVVEMQVPVAQGATGEATLEGMVVDLGDGRKQPANRPLTLMVGPTASAIPIIITMGGSGTHAAQAQVLLAQGPSSITVHDTGKASDFKTPPVVRNVSVIHGPLSGNAEAIHIAVDDQPVTVLAATPRSAIFELRPNTPPGAHTLILRDGDRSASASVVKTVLTMQAGQTQLKKGQSTNYTVTVLLGPLPDSVWQNGGSSLDRVGPAQADQFPSHFHAPKQGEPAAVLLRIENASRDTITLKPSKNEVITRVLHQQDFKDNQFNQSGTIQSKRSGGFVINGTVQTFFAPISCSELTQAAASGSTGGVLASAKEKLKGKDEGGSSSEAELSDEFQKGKNKSSFVPCEGGKGCDEPIFADDKGKKFKWVSCKTSDTCSKQCKDAVCRLFYKGKQGKSTPGGKDSKGHETPSGKDLPDPDNWMPTDSLRDKQKPNTDAAGRVESNPLFSYACVCTCPASK